MANLIFGWPIFSDDSVSQTPSFSGGDWEPTLPLANLKSRQLHKVARSVDDSVAATVVKVDLGTVRSIRMVAIPKHNLSTAAKARTRLFMAAPIVESNSFDTWTDWDAAVTTGQTDPLGATRASVLEDDNAAADEARALTVAFTDNGNKSAAISIRQGTSATSAVGIFDETATVWRHLVNVTWNGGVPSLATSSGAGTLYAPVQLNADWWIIQFTANSVVAANTNALYTYPAGTGSTPVGTSYYYEAMAFDYDGAPVNVDSGVDDAWPSGLDAEEADGINVPFVYLLPGNGDGRYIRVEIADTANADGYVELGRLIVAGGYQPTINMSYGARLGLESDSIRTVTDGGAAVYQEKAVRRTMNLLLENIAEAESFASTFQMQRRLGTSGQLFVVFDPDDDATLMHERSFLCVMRELHGLDFPYHTRARAAFQLVEEL